MDRLDLLFAQQKMLNDYIRQGRNLPEADMETWVQRYTLAMMSELSELIDEVNFKWWKNPTLVNPDRVKDEMVDILHFFLSMCLEAGMSPQELFDRYMDKHEENILRQQGRSEKTGYTQLNK